ncbi:MULTISPECIES: ABC1 kinase family protein [Prochlorococcus]|uniref:ABC1 kinase family protein n=1 Tax=Prochlorococcus TaxID=1218 RepID=UPI000533AC0D|nr:MULTISPECIES: AarF/UbiB family protein [Prochlorococcus]KGG12245.1 Ubiquinone biosynthesis monooxygenase UbiB [Prochlorococcus sp. MIT 0601]
MRYNPKRDFAWLIVQPWIWIPRLLQIIGSITIFIISFLIHSGSKDLKKQKQLAKDLLKRLTNLGPCFIKVGQALSTRPDLISKDWLEELTKLQDDLPAFEHAKAIQIIEKELGNNINNLFKIFPSEPIASASLGVVYKAQLKNNTYVAVKVQRPGLSYIIRRDIVIIKLLSFFVGPLLPLNLGFSLSEIIDEFGISLFEEIDYGKEADNAERFALLFSKNPSIRIPMVERMYSSDIIITTSWIEGIKLKDRSYLKENEIDPTAIIKTAVTSGIQQLLEFGYFHADPHPGNMFALKSKSGASGLLAYIDFGMMDSISETDRITLTGAIVHLINKDFLSLSKDFQKLGFLSLNQNLENIVPVLREVLGSVITKEVNSFNLKSITDKFSELMFEYPFRVPARFALIIRAVVSQEGLALKLDPSFKILRFAYPYIAKRLLIDQNEEMLGILMDVIFDNEDNIRVDRLEGLLEVLTEDTRNPGLELLPVARDSLKLLISAKGSKIRRKFLLSIIKDDKLNTSDVKNLLKLVHNKFNLSSLFKGIIKESNAITI